MSTEIAGQAHHPLYTIGFLSISLQGDPQREYTDEKRGESLRLAIRIRLCRAVGNDNVSVCFFSAS